MNTFKKFLAVINMLLILALFVLTIIFFNQVTEGAGDYFDRLREQYTGIYCSFEYVSIGLTLPFISYITGFFKTDKTFVFASLLSLAGGIVNVVFGLKLSILSMALGIVIFALSCAIILASFLLLAVSIVSIVKDA